MKKILIADDSATAVMHLSILIRKMGFRVLTAKDGMGTLRLLSEEKPDLILLDLNMPIMDGFAVLRQLRADTNFQRIPVVVVTIEGDDISRKRCLDLGANAFMTKPVHLSALHDVIQSTLDTCTGARKHMRAHFEQAVTLTSEGVSRVLMAVSLSEGGIYLRSVSPLPIGARVEVEIPNGQAPALRLAGTVLYRKDVFCGEVKIDPGFAIGFDPVEPRQAFHLRCLVKDLLAAGVAKDPEGTDIIF